jgi:hypothetical protein
MAVEFSLALHHVTCFLAPRTRWNQGASDFVVDGHGFSSGMFSISV